MSAGFFSTTNRGRENEPMSDKPSITPQTRVSELLDAYPELEQMLAAQTPVFEKLKNPVLRKTVAKVATLEKAAAIAGIPVEKLVSELRKAVGQSAEIPVAGSPPPTASRALDSPERPQWLDPEKVAHRIDADEYLSRGEHPLNKVIQLSKGLSPGQSLRLVSSFRPLPLIEKLEELGHPAWCAESEPGRFETFIGAK